MKRKFTLTLMAMFIINFIAIVFTTPIPVSAAYDGYNWSSVTKKTADWYKSAEGIALGDDIIKYQLSTGGWKKNMDGTDTGSWGKATTDNDATTSQIIILAKIYNATGTAKYRTACEKAIDLLFIWQYANGGWSQIYDDPGTYHAAITYNDGAMIRVMQIMKSVSEKSGDFAFIDSTRQSKAKTALDKGVRCLLDTQIVSKGTKTAWGQQHDEKTLEPCYARAYELPSICTSESVGIVNFLKSIEQTTEIANSINFAVKFLTDVQINGIRIDNITTDGAADRIVVADSSAPPIWTRFYELDTHKPMFADRDGSKYYEMAQISQERRAGYAWYGDWPKDIVAKGFVPVPAETKPESLNGTLIKSLDRLDNTNAANWSIQTDLQQSNKIYGDRDFTFLTIPEFLKGAEWIRTACDSKNMTENTATFTAGKAITVYIALDTRVTSELSWLSGWTKTTEIITASNDVSYYLYKKDFSETNIISLGTNGSPTGVVMYSVFAVKKDTVITTTTTTSTLITTTTSTSTTTSLSVSDTTTTPVNPDALIGDVNLDGKISISDIILLAKAIGKKVTLNEKQKINANCHIDPAVNGEDLLALIKYIAGAIDNLPIGTSNPVVTTTSTIPLTTTTTTTTAITTTTTTTAANQLTLEDMPTAYKDSLSWLWDVRQVRENSVDRKNLIFDQILAGKGTLNYVVRWQSNLDITLQQRKDIEVMIGNQINNWTQYLIGYDDWPYKEITVKVVGWAVPNASQILDKQADEIVYTDTTVDGNPDFANIPLPNAPSSLSRFDHFTQMNYQYPGGLDKRFDMYLWGTAGFNGGAGGDWGQRISDTYILQNSKSSAVHIIMHEIGHGFGLYDFYNDEDRPATTQSGIFGQGDLKTIMWAGNSNTITDYDGWMLRYYWSRLKAQSGRINLS